MTVLPPVPQDDEAVPAVMVARDIADLYESAGMQPVWQAERWEKRLGLR